MLSNRKLTYLSILLLGLLLQSSLKAQSIDKMISEYEKESDPSKRVELLLPIIDSLAFGESLEEALVYAHLAVQISEDQQSDVLKMKSYMRLAHVYYEKQMFHIAVDYGVLTSELAAAVGDKQVHADALNLLSISYDNLGKYQLSLEASLDAASIYEELGQESQLAYCYNDIGVIQYYLGNNDLAEEYYVKAKEKFEDLEDERGVSMCLNNHANVVGDRGDYETAIDMYFKALQYDLKSGDVYGQIIDYSNIGETYTAMKNYQKGEEYLLKSLNLAEVNNDTWGMTNPLNGLATNYYGLGNIPKAIEYAERSLVIARSIDAADESLSALEQLYEFYKELGDHRTALKYHEEYFALNDSIYNQQSTSTIYEMQERFNSKDRQKELELLKREKEIDALEHKKDIEERKSKEILLWAGLALFLVVTGLVSSGFIMKRRDNKKLEQQKKEIVLANEKLSVALDQIEEKNRDITDSIKYAQQIQEAMLPSIEQLRSVFPESFIFFRPRDIVSGDFYWLHETEEFMFIAVADCTGHGVPGAFVSMLCSNVLNQLVIENGIEDCGTVLTEANNTVNKALKQRSNIIQSKDGMDICLARIEKESAKLEYAGAMNTVVVNNGTEMITGDNNRNPIGGRTEYGYEFSTYSIQLETGHSLYMFTDGFPDQFGGPRGKKYKSGSLKDFLKSIEKNPMTMQDELLDSELKDWKGDLEQLDDICIVGVKI